RKLMDGGGGAREKQGGRLDRRDPPLLLNYKLKASVRQILGIKLLDFPGPAALVSWRDLRRYSVSDVIGAKALHDYLWPHLGRQTRRYHAAPVSPLAPILLRMTLVGIRADAHFPAHEA